MKINYATYRIGFDKHEPPHRNGTEITETTEKNPGDFIDETEKLLGEISLLWMAPEPMPRMEKQL